jgi:hypothetical protein
MWMYDDPSFNICVFVAKSVGGQSFRTKVTFFTTKYQPCESFPFLNKLLYCFDVVAAFVVDDSATPVYCTVSIVLLPRNRFSFCCR